MKCNLNIYIVFIIISGCSPKKFVANKNNKDLTKEEQFKEATDRHDKLTTDMVSKNCPINCGYCSVDCVHFNKGDVYWRQSRIDYETEILIFNPPKCKLWKS